MEIQKCSTTPGEFYQLQNINTVRWESRNIATQQREMDYRKSKVIAFVVSAGMNVIILKSRKKFPCLIQKETSIQMYTPF